MSIMPQDSESKTETYRPTLRGVAAMMASSGDPVTRAVAELVSNVAYQHEDPVICTFCSDEGGPCPAHNAALAVAFTWLIELVEERA